MTNPGAPPSQPVSQAVGARPGLGPPRPDGLGGGAEVTFSRPKTASEAGAEGGGEGVRVSSCPLPPPTAVKP